jgi:hypothetical protein
VDRQVDVYDKLTALVDIAISRQLTSLRVDGVEFTINPGLYAKPVNIDMGNLKSARSKEEIKAEQQKLLFWSAK